MGRMHPTECEHGNVIDWGDFGPENGPEPTCDECEERSALVLTDVEWRDLGSIVAYYKQTTSYANELDGVPLMRATMLRRHSLCDRILDALGNGSRERHAEPGKNGSEDRT